MARSYSQPPSQSFVLSLYNGTILRGNSSGSTLLTHKLLLSPKSQHSIALAPPLRALARVLSPL